VNPALLSSRVYFLHNVVSFYTHSRWDTHAHRLADFNYSDPTMEIYPGQDYSDARLRDFEQGNNQQVLYCSIYFNKSNKYSQGMGYEIN
jgi:hypothetical protein